MSTEVVASPRARRRLEVRGIVQGVGFRPFVYRLAQELALAGWVRNDDAGVTVEVEGALSQVERMVQRIASEAPSLARVDGVEMSAALPLGGERAFSIVASDSAAPLTMIGPDSAVCDACLADLFDPANRRYRYALTNCTHCGPRYTITRGLPYDRRMTSMSSFAQCPACMREYRDPADRRFHAEPNACAQCGPVLRLVDARGIASRSEGGDPIAQTIARIRGGDIVAIKGLGGYHLACDARNARAVASLRERKHRDEKPFAVMTANLASARCWVVIGESEAAALQSRERPIVLLPKRDRELDGVAPGLSSLGVMLPYTPLQHLLFHEAAGRPMGTAWLEQAQDLVLVMTSANPGGEPLVTEDAEALERLDGIADALLVHDRRIVVRCDDSVLRLTADQDVQFIRRARGYTPRAIPLSRTAPSVLALGGHFKNTICVTRRDEAFVSEHVGDLDNAATCRALEDTVAHLLSILRVRPASVAHDLHPEFFSTQLAARVADHWHVPLVAVQHHHAHVASVLAEHRVEAPTLGLALDGVGLGTDGTAWGGELLLVHGAHFERLGHFAPLRLPGGDRAAREPWRMACAALAAGSRASEITQRFAHEPAAPSVAAMLEREWNAPLTTSAGRWFDAAAGLLGIKPRTTFEGQAAMLLEGLAQRHGSVSSIDALFAISRQNALDLSALLMTIADAGHAGYAAALFHATLVKALTVWVMRAVDATGIRNVACGGGCFLNAIIARGLRDALAGCDVHVLESRLVPPNDGGIALGQAWIAQRMTTDA